MNIDIRKGVIDKIKNDDANNIIETINQSITSKNELVLPGLGVMLELFWNNLNNKAKYDIACIIKNNIN